MEEAPSNLKLTEKTATEDERVQGDEHDPDIRSVEDKLLLTAHSIIANATANVTAHTAAHQVTVLVLGGPVLARSVAPVIRDYIIGVLMHAVQHTRDIRYTVRDIRHHNPQLGKHMCGLHLM